ncbi:MAG: glycerol-3-phosphate 1-O-acyltransferase PlsY [Clostridia bacterium]|nr:glycerol-3-phosphate 1-O-acyltransferase PlsY [Clostridia bacterium]
MNYLYNIVPGMFGLMVRWAESQTDKTAYYVIFISALVLTAAAGYLLGSLNSAIIVSKTLFRKDIRQFGSGNAGLTNMFRVYGKKGALLTLLGDVLKQVVSVFLGIIIAGQTGAYIAGLFCMIGHIFPVYYGFKGGKGVLTAATMILIIDPVIFLVLIVVFAVVLLFTQYVSLASIIAAITYPAAVFYAARIRTGNSPSIYSMLFALFVGLIVIFMHRSNIFRIFNNEESKFSFRSKPQAQDILDAEDRENDKANEYVPEIRKKKKVRKGKYSSRKK